MDTEVVRVAGVAGVMEKYFVQGRDIDFDTGDYLEKVLQTSDSGRTCPFGYPLWVADTCLMVHPLHLLIDWLDGMTDCVHLDHERIARDPFVGQEERRVPQGSGHQQRRQPQYRQ